MATQTDTSQKSRTGKFLVSKVKSSTDLRADIEKAVELIGGFESFIQPGDLVTIKPNLNTADPYPASSDADFVQALGEALLAAGAGKLQIMDASTQRVCTRDVGEEIGICDVAMELNADFISLDEHPWIKQQFSQGKYLKSGHIGEPALKLGKLVVAPCLKTHFIAKFTASLKVLMGLLKRQDRLKMHMRKLEYKIADLASYFEPALVVMDARKVFVTKGPASGQVETPNVILASPDMVAIDVEGVRILQGYKAQNKLNKPVWELGQIARAKEIGFGARNDEEIQVIEYP
ncbi:MAG: DUF362 domain-containing protein [Candidatus Hermodarchaeia archaeon]|jgi:uncharacterized protein (DUF362 family)